MFVTHPLNWLYAFHGGTLAGRFYIPTEGKLIECIRIFLVQFPLPQNLYRLNHHEKSLNDFFPFVPKALSCMSS